MAIMLCIRLVSRREVGILFLCTLFLVFAFGALRSTPRADRDVTWTIDGVGLAACSSLPTSRSAMPISTQLERFATMLVLRPGHRPLHVPRHLRQLAAQSCTGAASS